MKITCVLIAITCCINGGSGSDRLVYEMDLNEALKTDMVFYHNYRRSIVSPSASNMVMLEWDDDLAREASEFVKNCAFEHSDPPLQSLKYGQLGENLYAGDEFRFHDIPPGVIWTWYNEVKDYDIDRSPKCVEGKECGHYTQLVWAETTHVGCAISVCSNILHGHGRHLMACMYGPAGNGFTHDMKELPPYKIGEPCSECPNDRRWCIAGLCRGGYDD